MMKETFIYILILASVLFHNIRPTCCKNVLGLHGTPAGWVKPRKLWKWTSEKNLQTTQHNHVKSLKTASVVKARGTKSNTSLSNDAIASETKGGHFGAGGISNSAILATKASFNKAVLTAHNEYRQMHHSPHLDLDKQLNTQAQEYAKELSVLGLAQLRHSQGYKEKKYGENIFASCDAHVFPIDAVKTWYFQVCKYDFLTHMPTEKNTNIEDFTQVVWRGTEKLGVGRAIGLYNKKPCTYIVAQYQPRRNSGKRRNNVDIGDFNKEICVDSSYVGFGARG